MAQAGGELEQLEAMAAEVQAEAGAKGKAIGTAAAVLGAALAIVGSVIDTEGAYVNHPNDPGGATRWGVTEREARAAGYRGDMRYFPKSCTGRATICAKGIYLERYIAKPGYLPLIEADPAVGEEIVDSAVNFGPPRPSRWFQQSMNELGGGPIAVDGVVGPATIAAYRRLQVRFGDVAACRMTLDTMDAKQLAEYRRLVRVNAKLKVFYRGWVAKRIGNVDRARCGKGIV